MKQTVITIEEFNKKHPIGSIVKANVFPGLRECQVVAEAKELSENEDAFLGNYDDRFAVTIPLKWVITETEATSEQK